MAKKPKETAPVAPVETAGVTLEMVAQATATDPYFIYVPADTSAAWLAEGLVEVNPDMVDDGGALATRITEKGQASLMNTATDNQNNGAEGASTPAASNEFAIELIDVPQERRAPSAASTNRYPFDQLPAPTVGEDGKPKASAFFIPATAERPKPHESLASTVSTAKARYARKTGERPYKAKEAVKNADGSPALGADGKPVYREVTKTRDINEYDRVFRITEGTKVVKSADGTEQTIKGAWVSRTK